MTIFARHRPHKDRILPRESLRNGTHSIPSTALDFMSTWVASVTLTPYRSRTGTCTPYRSRTGTCPPYRSRTGTGSPNLSRIYSRTPTAGQSSIREAYPTRRLHARSSKRGACNA